MSLTRLLLPVLAIASIASTAGAQSTGVATWYGGWRDGMRTSSGERFDQEGMTAASRSIPLGTRVRVTSSETGQSVIVKVNDRMGSRFAIIDLSKGAARQIGLLGRGRGTVSIETTDEQPIEVAEASEDETADVAQAAPRARRHAARRTSIASRPCCHGASIYLASGGSRGMHPDRPHA